MYLVPQRYSPGNPLSSEVVDLGHLAKQAAWTVESLGVLQVQWQWPQYFAWENIVECLRSVFEHPERWLVHAFHAVKWFFTTHTHIVYLVSLSIFFGPIIVLIPLLLLHEFVISVIFNLSFIFHGLLPGTIDDHYVYIHSVFDDLKGFTFSCVDKLGARYNKLTTRHWFLLVVRLFCLGIGGLALYHIVGGNQSQ